MIMPGMIILYPSYMYYHSVVIVITTNNYKNNHHHIIKNNNIECTTINECASMPTTSIECINEIIQ